MEMLKVVSPERSSSIRGKQITGLIVVYFENVTICRMWAKLMSLGSGSPNLHQVSLPQMQVEESYDMDVLGPIRVKSVTREAKHTLAHTGLMLWDAGPVFARYLVNATELLNGAPPPSP